MLTNLVNLFSRRFYIVFITIFLVLVVATITAYAWYQHRSLNNIKIQYTNVQAELEQLKNEDQYQRNQELRQQIDQVEQAFNQTTVVYESINDLQVTGVDTKELQILLASSLKLLSELKYEEAEVVLEDINGNIVSIKDDIARKEREQAEAAAIAAAKAAAAAKPKPAPTPAPAPEPEPEPEPDNSLPSDGEYKRIIATVNATEFTVSLVAASVQTTKTVVDTTSDAVCEDNCPVLPLHDYTARSGAFAGINGTYFCPAAYPSCASAKDSFDLVVMNRQKTYINQADQLTAYPAVVFGENHTQFINDVADWNTSITNINGLLSNYPLMVTNRQVVFFGSSIAKLNSRSNRSFVASLDNLVFIGVVHHASVAEAAIVLQALGMQNALNLDSGGSTALWYQGSYQVGPGRNLPNVILFIKK